MNTLQEYRESVTALMNEASAMNKDTNALDVLSTFRSLRWAVSELESAIMADIFPTSKENN
jgi:hypothetical protein